METAKIDYMFYKTLEKALYKKDPSKTVWIEYWCLNGLLLLSTEENPFKKIEPFKAKIKEKLDLHRVSGLWGRGVSIPIEELNLADTWAAIILSTQLNLISDHYDLLSNFLKKVEVLRRPNGSIRMHSLGEGDLRSLLIIANVMFSLFTHLDEGKKKEMIRPIILSLGKSVGFLNSCFCPGGGIGSYPNNEAHAGYTLCGLYFYCVYLKLVKLYQTDYEAENKKGAENFPMVENLMEKVATLTEWLSSRQTLDGGLSGRKDKDSDTCYSFWVSNCIYFCNYLKKCVCGSKEESESLNEVDLLEHLESYNINYQKLENYLLLCFDEELAMFRKYPGVEGDLFHTFYVCVFLSYFKNKNKYVFFNPWLNYVVESK